MKTFPHHRIVVIGTTSSGKSTLAEELSKRANLDYSDVPHL